MQKHNEQQQKKTALLGEPLNRKVYNTILQLSWYSKMCNECSVLWGGGGKAKKTNSNTATDTG